MNSFKWKTTVISMFFLCHLAQPPVEHVNTMILNCQSTKSVTRRKDNSVSKIYKMTS